MAIYKPKDIISWGPVTERLIALYQIEMRSVMERQKSILDGMKTKEDGFPINNRGLFYDASAGSNPPSLEVVSSCPSCGSPVYGNKSIQQGSFPVVIHSCDCRQRGVK